MWHVHDALKPFSFPFTWYIFEHSRDTRATTQRQPSIPFKVKEMQETLTYRFQFQKTAVASLSPDRFGITVPSPLPWRLWMRPGPIGCCIDTRLASPRLWTLRSLRLIFSGLPHPHNFCTCLQTCFISSSPWPLILAGFDLELDLRSHLLLEINLTKKRIWHDCQDRVSQKMWELFKLFLMKAFSLTKIQGGQVSNSSSKPPASYRQI